MKLFLHILNIFSLLVISFGLGIWNLGLGIFATCAQPYAPINPNRVAYFEYDNYYYGNIFSAIRIDSIKIDSSFTVYKNYSTFGEDPYYINWDCVDLYDTSWTGYQVLNKPNGDYIFFNRWLDSIVIKTQALLNENWIMCVFPDSSYFMATVSDFTTDFILGQLDSIKTISLQKKSKTGANIPDPFNNQQIKLGKNSGFIQTYFLHKFPLDTSVRTLTGLTNPDMGVHNPTVETIFNFDVGDIFHFSAGYSNFSLGGEERLIKRIVIGKSYSIGMDTLTYLYYDSIYYSTFYNSTWDTLFIDTFTDIVSLNNPIFDNLPFEPIINIYGNSLSIDYNYFKPANNYNDKLAKYLSYAWFNYSDTCWHSMHIDECGAGIDRYFIEGCGAISSGNGLFGTNGWACWKTLEYFKKGSEEWGTPIVFPGIAEQNVEKPKVKISPNPFSEKAVLEIQGMRLEHAGFELMIYDLLGNTLVNYHSAGLMFEIDRNGLSSGIYFYKLFEKDNLLHVGKIIIE